MGSINCRKAKKRAINLVESGTSINSGTDRAKIVGRTEIKPTIWQHSRVHGDQARGTIS